MNKLLLLLLILPLVSAAENSFDFNAEYPKIASLDQEIMIIAKVTNPTDKPFTDVNIEVTSDIEGLSGDLEWSGKINQIQTLRLVTYARLTEKKTYNIEYLIEGNTESGFVTENHKIQITAIDKNKYDVLKINAVIALNILIIIFLILRFRKRKKK